MALIKCPDCGKEFSDSAKQCPNCGYKNKVERKINYSLIKREINYSLIGGGLLIMLGLFQSLVVIPNNNLGIYYEPVTYIFLLILGIVLIIAGGILISKKYEKAKKITYIAAGVILVIDIIVTIIGYHNAFVWEEYRAQRNSESSAQTENISGSENSAQAEERYVSPSTKDFYFGTWEYTQPNNQDGISSVKLVVNPDKTVQALLDVKGKEITIYGSWDWLGERIWMQFNDTEEHINGLLYIDHLRIFKGYNDYFGIKYGQIKNEDGITYLYEDSSDAKARNPNKRVELKKIN